ncbi:SWIB/MDM2 domain-containing protein [Scheffersomyces xylosifermentans]|uniref:SWIB/MDM2 domain-containing protein n=1 Tax=Scheffersomyces xylosifermentans TaxID=1304137 RepID=UPI00315DFDA5
MSSEYKPERYLPTIDAILSVANLEEITVKRIRNALQELFGVDLQQHKKEINEVILGRYYDLVDKRAEEEKSEKQRRKEIERQDALMAAQLSKSEINGPVMRARTVLAKRGTPDKKSSKVTKPKKERKKREGPVNNGFNREMILSTELSDVLGLSRCSRPQVVKQLWAYIKDRELQNPNDKRQIFCDEKLQNVFKKKTVGAFEMNKFLSKHIFKPEEIGETNSSGSVKKEKYAYDSEEDEDDNGAEGDESDESIEE